MLLEALFLGELSLAFLAPVFQLLHGLPGHTVHVLGALVKEGLFSLFFNFNVDRLLKQLLLGELNRQILELTHSLVELLVGVELVLFIHQSGQISNQIYVFKVHLCVVLLERFELLRNFSTQISKA